MGSEIPRVSRAVVVVGGDRKEEQEHAERTREVLGIAEFGLAAILVQRDEVIILPYLTELPLNLYYILLHEFPMSCTVS